MTLLVVQHIANNNDGKVFKIKSAFNLITGMVAKYELPHFAVRTGVSGFTPKSGGAVPLGMSALCQSRLLCSAANEIVFDRLIGALFVPNLTYA